MIESQPCVINNHMMCRRLHQVHQINQHKEVKSDILHNSVKILRDFRSFRCPLRIPSCDQHVWIKILTTKTNLSFCVQQTAYRQMINLRSDVVTKCRPDIYVSFIFVQVRYANRNLTTSPPLNTSNYDQHMAYKENIYLLFIVTGYSQGVFLT